MFQAKIEPSPKKRMVPQRFSPASLEGCVRSATGAFRAALPECASCASYAVFDAPPGCATPIPQKFRHRDIFF
jgi:hypothetical protein